MKSTRMVSVLAAKSKSAPVTCHGGETPKAASNSLSVIPDPVPAQVQLTHSKLKRGFFFLLDRAGSVRRAGQAAEVVPGAPARRIAGPWPQAIASYDGNLIRRVAGRRHAGDHPLQDPGAMTADRELTILMPCLNEAETLATCIGKARGYLEAHGIDGEVLVADNGSTDGSI